MGGDAQVQSTNIKPVTALNKKVSPSLAVATAIGSNLRREGEFDDHTPAKKHMQTEFMAGASRLPSLTQHHLLRSTLCPFHMWLRSYCGTSPTFPACVPTVDVLQGAARTVYVFESKLRKELTDFDNEI